MISALAMSLVFATPALDAWTIKAPLAKDSKSVWSVTVNAAVSGGDHEAHFNFEQTVVSSDEKGAKASLSWKDLSVDGNQMDGPDEFKSSFGKRGELTSVESEFGDDARRMLNVFLFVYPDQAVEVGQKWVYEFAPASTEKRKFTSSFEALAVEKVKDIEALKIACKTEETGEAAMKSDSIFWVARDGRVLKFEAKVKNWVVPVAGPGEPVEATIKGEIAIK